VFATDAIAFIANKTIKILWLRWKM
jgi:hypothetical protein